MAKFHGLCIGGSLAGQWVSRLESSFQVAIRSEPGPLCYEKLCAEAKPVNHDRETYLFHSYPFDTGSWDIWLLSGKNLHWALKELMETYAIYEDMK